jgi:hypothetical protein
MARIAEAATQASRQSTPVEPVHSAAWCRPIRANRTSASVSQEGAPLTTKTIRYHIPSVGTISARLHAESRELFAFLEGTGEISRLRRLDHLGAVRLAYDGAHHSRWEYIATVLALVDRAGTIHRTQLHSEVRSSGVVLASSGEELLKSWALLLNVGHLHWTFAAERILLQELWRSRGARLRFRQSLPARFQAGAEAVLRDGDYYSLYQYISVHRLERLATAVVDAPQWESIMAAYILAPRTDQVERLRRIFRRLRRVAYLGLDTQYAPSAVGLDLGRVLTDERALERHALADRAAEEAELIALDAHMARTVYLGRNVLAAAACREERLRAAIRRGLRDPRHLSDLIEKLANGEHQKDRPQADLTPAVRVVVRPFAPLDSFISHRINPRREEYQLRQGIAARGAKAIPAFWTIPGTGEWVMQMHVARDDTRAAASSVGTVLARLSDYREGVQRELGFLDEVDLQALLLEPVARDLVVAALVLTFGPNTRWEWGITSGPQAALGPRARLRELVSAEIRALSTVPGSKPRRAELELLYNMLLGSPGVRAAISISGIKGFVADARVPSVEFDCVLIQEVSGRLEIVLGEAKTGAGSSTAARSQLARQLADLRPVSAATLRPPRLIRSKLRKTQVRPKSRATASVVI